MPLNATPEQKKKIEANMERIAFLHGELSEGLLLLMKSKDGVAFAKSRLAEARNNLKGKLAKLDRIEAGIDKIQSEIRQLKAENERLS